MIGPLESLGISREALLERKLREYAEADILQQVGTARDGRPHRLTPPAASAWHALEQAALADGISLFIVSAFRSFARQDEIFRNKLTDGLAIDEILAVSAPPGFSEHHTGRAVDLSTPGCPSLTAEFANTPAFAWLAEHAGNFGFYLSYPPGNASGYDYEPWHWCFEPADASGKS